MVSYAFFALFEIIFNTKLSKKFAFDIRNYDKKAVLTSGLALNRLYLQ